MTSSKEVYTNLYSTVWLKCEARYPSVLETPVTFWFSNNTLINAKTVQHYRHNVYKPRARPNSTTILPFDLRITNVSSKDFGWYSCAVQFTVGEAKVHLSQDLKLAKRGGTLCKHNVKVSNKLSTFFTFSFIFSFFLCRFLSSSFTKHFCY